MPWCEPCGRFYNPNTLTPEGQCADGHQVADPATDNTRVPWHFWALLLALAIYLGWRLVQGLLWLAG